MEAWISVAEEAHGNISSSGSEGHDTELQNTGEALEPNVPGEGPETVDMLELGAVGGIKLPAKFDLKRSESRCHLRVSTEIHYLMPINMRPVQ